MNKDNILCKKCCIIVIIIMCVCVFVCLGFFKFKCIEKICFSLIIYLYKNNVDLNFLFIFYYKVELI